MSVVSVDPRRKCGSCDACCWALGVDPVQKAAHETCRFKADGGGCGIYKNRPHECRAYSCAWLDGETVQSPLECGVIFTTVRHVPPEMGEALGRLGLKRRLISAHDARPGGMDDLEGRAAITAWVDRGYAVMRMRGDKRELIVPQAASAALKAVAG